MITENSLLQIVLYLVSILLLAKPLGWYMTRVYEQKSCGLDRCLQPIENLIYRFLHINPQEKMRWTTYLSCVLIFNLAGFLTVYLILRLQSILPLNPQHFPALSPDLAFNTAASFITNTDWQAYSGESTFSYFSQLFTLTVQNFLSAATGMTLAIALIRGMVKKESTNLGNFWVDLLRTVLYILLPLAIIFSVFLVSQGVIQNLKPYQKISMLDTIKLGDQLITEQTLPMGPVASLVAIKQLGSNGGGFFNTNSAHPFENPTPLSNFFEMLAIVLIPTAFCYTFGKMAKDTRQGWAILAAMFLIFIPCLLMIVTAEQQGNPAFNQLNIDQLSHFNLAAGGNMEGKETRFGVTDSAMWAAATTATSNGSTNAMLDSFTPIGGLIPLWLMHLGEVVFGGVGVGLSSMLMMVIITVFIAGLMVGRTPEYLGKKIEPYEIKMASIAVLIMPLTVLILTAVACLLPIALQSLGNPGVHGFTEILYNFTSMLNNNGSSFAGLNANTPFYNIVGGIAILIGRFWIAIPTLALAGSLIRKKITPVSPGTLSTHSALFVMLIVFIVLLLGALTFFPALSLGPIVEHLSLGSQHGR